MTRFEKKNCFAQGPSSERVFYLQSYLMMKKEKTLGSSQDSNLGPLNWVL